MREGGCRFKAVRVKEKEKASEHRQRKREAEEAGKVEVAPGVTVAGLRRFRAALIGPPQGLFKRRRLCMPIGKLETLRVRCCRCYAFGCMIAIRGGYQMARGWHYTKLSLSSALLLSSFFLACASCCCSFLSYFCHFWLVFCFVLLPCSRWSFVDVPPIFSCPADHVPDWQPHNYWVRLRPDWSM